MELRRFWIVFKRRWLLLLLPAVIVLAVGLATYRPAPLLYNAGVRFIIGQPPAMQADTIDEERYHNWLTSEYIVNSLTDWVRSGMFATAVSEYLAAQGIELPAGAILGGIAADNSRSLLTVSLTGGDPQVLVAAMDGVAVVLSEQNADALPQLGGETAVVTQLDQPIVNPIGAGFRSQLDLPLRIVLALAAGLGLALLVEYLDPTVRDREDVEKAGLALLSEIPRK